MNPRSRAALAALAAAALLLLSGCGGSGDSPASAKPTKGPSSSSVSGKTQVVRLENYGLSFEIPAGWTKIQAGGVLRADSPVVKNFASKLGRTPDQVVTMLSSTIKMMAVSDQGMDRGFLENVNAVAVAATSMTAEQLKLQFLGIGAKVVRTTTVSTTFGKSFQISYTLETGATPASGCALAIDTGSNVVVLTVSAHDVSQAESRIAEIRSSVEKL